MKRYWREDYSDFSWFELMKSMGESLPLEYCDIFDRDGEISEDYDLIFNVDIYCADKEIN